jgi:magnesium transporter
LTIPADPAEPAHVRLYRKGVLDREGLPLEEVSDVLEDPEAVLWIDFCRPSEETMHQLAEELGLHQLAVEDALGDHQRPKIDHYASHLFLACHAVKVDPDTGRLDETEIDAFISKHWLVTVRKDDGFSMDPVCTRWERSPDLATQGVPYLLYGLLDVVIDGYFDALQEFDDFYDEISESIFSEHPLPPTAQRHWFDMRRALVRFHRLAVPMREAISALMRREHDAVSEPMYPYVQDLYDHILRVSESTDALRDLVSTIVETNISLRDYRQNQIMKQVTSWAAIVAVPTLITGYYGMNLPYPGEGQTWGWILSVILIVVLSGGLYLVFKRKEWL